MKNWRFATGFVAAVMVVLTILGVPMSAHHGSATSYDISKQVTMTGVVTLMQWRNPHCFIMYDVTEADGKVVNWGAETHPPAMLIRNEVNDVPVPWTATTVKPGDKVTITVFPSRIGAPRGLLAKIVDAHGKVLLDDGSTRTRRAPAPTQ